MLLEVAQIQTTIVEPILKGKVQFFLHHDLAVLEIRHVHLEHDGNVLVAALNFERQLRLDQKCQRFVAIDHEELVLLGIGSVVARIEIITIQHGEQILQNFRLVVAPVMGNHHLVPFGVEFVLFEVAGISDHTVYGGEHFTDSGRDFHLVISTDTISGCHHLLLLSLLCSEECAVLE